jgi:aryl-alcohol dehydrogenase-like predicted oxidoreductase
MVKRRLGRSELEFEPLVFGCNVLGWTLQEEDAFTVLDAFLDLGFSAIDTADIYGKGRSEEILGRWMKSRGNRDRVLIFTKFGSEMAPGKKGLKAAYAREALAGSLARLQTDYVDLYQCHRPDPGTPIAETLEGLDALVREGKVRAIGTSNFSGEMLTEAFAAADEKGLARFESDQPEYNLYARERYEGGVQQAALKYGIGIIPYFSLAAGFLTGKYRSEADLGQSPRGERVARYLDGKGNRILEALDKVSAETGAPPAEIALAWLLAQPGITAPIASATSIEQLNMLARGIALPLRRAHLDLLTAAGR